MIKAVLSGLAALLVGAQANAATVTLFDCAIQIDEGPISSVCGSTLGSGIGTFSVQVDAPGNHFVGGFFDYEIGEDINTFYNEFGGTWGTLAANQSWEIDEPGWVFGNIYTNLHNGTLDNNIFDGVVYPSGEDVSMAMGWSFSGSAIIEFTFSDVAPSSGFYLTQYDPDSDYTIYFSSTLTPCVDGECGGGGQVPEPGSLFLLGAGLMGLAATRRRKLGANG